MNIKDNYVYEHPYLTLANLYVLQRETSSTDCNITCTLPSWNKQSMPCIINKVVILCQSSPEVMDISLCFDQACLMRPGSWTSYWLSSRGNGYGHRPMLCMHGKARIRVKVKLWF